ncbi:related to YTA7-26S proteasome subunit [Zygosaccharomyces bailii ISA1307]|uniref:ZYBA0S07-02278g1_1 n=1 Tax=Zygosaccharomyces bailii (strain CLIB 213 / ATCC 58445 / CBS 680 / BCRC 21525 / NBRC 1098 / NCYC 1416 / NRRL Y-2227) TaxID=1333698 RepID=A0A8J2X997_ZYGB2|nr:ZYBA0S07-02278g1_1 [Zygosaccharomyces bailii CLIB 213]CDH15141.1 related to YTA7-26S proteasome subunit [Zygosaccharomyces bailii ISA1307]
MAHHLRSRHARHEDGPDGPLEEEGFRDDNGIIHTSSRSLRKINYAEIESGFDFLENEDGVQSSLEQPTSAPPADDEDEDDDVDENAYRPQNGNRRSRRRRTRGKVADADEDDESFHEDDIEDEDDDDEIDSDGEAIEGDVDYAKRRRQREDKNFVVPDPEDGDEDDDDDEGIGYYSGRRKRGRPRREHSLSPSLNVAKRLRRRTRSAHTSHDEDIEDLEAISLRDEIRELQEDSPVQEKRSLRERTKPVNYKLPPPLLETNSDAQLERQSTATNSFKNISPRRRRGGNNVGPARRLFPTGGPFGGNDVTTIFGKNTNFYHQGPNVDSVNNPNKLLLDSDSSEDEILPLGAKPKPKSEDLAKKKKKTEIADLDPVGVDMNVKFEDVGGLDNYIDQLKEMVALPLLYPELYQNFDITPPRGVLFHGPPGTGKTLMARALAASCSSEGRKITFFMRKGADVLSKWVGEAERQLRLLFEEAKKQQPSVIFFDEIDGLAPVRSSKQEQIHASIVSTLLALMDGMDNRGQVIVIGATNRPDAVDPALRRPGRFDREFYFPLPDAKSRIKILKIHTKSWNPPLSDKFINQLAPLTKGFGGADLRALCTEAALLSIQRKYPQIYRSNEKLEVDPKEVKVGIRDFMLALKKIVPSSARSSGNAASPLPDNIKPLLQMQFENVTRKLEQILPEDDSDLKKDSSLIQEYLDYEDYDAGSNYDEGNSDELEFTKHEILSRLAKSRICNPKLLITGPAGNGQQYIGAALLNYFEQFNVQRLDLASLLSEGTRTIEAAVVQGFVEARRRQPSIIFIPNIDIWSQAVPETAVLTLTSLFRSLQSNERVLLLGVSEVYEEGDVSSGPLSHFSFSDNICFIDVPTRSQRTKYFEAIDKIVHMKPIFFKTKRRRRKPLPVLPAVKPKMSAENSSTDNSEISPTEILRRKLKQFQHQDMRLKNILKIKLSGLMDLFKNRYKRFRKPAIEDDYLVHLFEPPTDPNWQPAYTKDNDMILEIATGRRFFNMDLDIVEERLWNGYYSEPKQYLKDIELIYRDANTMGDRERVIKASEMFANAQMGIEDMSTPEFIKECKATRQRDLERQELFLRDEESKIATEQKQLESCDAIHASDTPEIVGVGEGNQLQAQLEISEPRNESVLGAVVDTGTTGGFSNNPIQGSTETVEGLSNPDEANAGINEKITEDNTEAGVEHARDTDGSAIPNFTENREEKIGVEAEQNNTIKTGDVGSVGFGDHSDSSRAKIAENTADENVIQVHSQHLNNIGLTRPKDAEKEQNDQVDMNGCSQPDLVAKDDGFNEDDDTTKKLTIDEESLSSMVLLLIEKTEGYTVSRLEELYSRIMDLAWADRFLWDKSGTITNILHFINNH